MTDDLPSHHDADDDLPLGVADPQVPRVDEDGADTDDEVEEWHRRAKVRREVMVLTGVGLVLTLVFGTITYLRSWVDDQVYEASVVSPYELELAVGTCGLEHRASVEEGDDVVEVLVQHRRTGDRNDCVELVTVQLDAPLGDRRVVDRSDGVSIPVCPEPSSPRTACVVR